MSDDGRAIRASRLSELGYLLGLLRRPEVDNFFATDPERYARFATVRNGVLDKYWELYLADLAAIVNALTAENGNLRRATTEAKKEVKALADTARALAQVENVLTVLARVI